MNTEIIQAAQALKAAGYSPLAIIDGEKRPSHTWTEFQIRPMTDQEINVNFRNAQKIGVACGSGSGNLECLDFDEPGLFAPFLELLATRCPELAEKIQTITRQTPSGGYHLIYRCKEPIQKNLKLACKEGTGDDLVLIETRGQGGQFVSAPSPGYTVIKGSLLTDCPIMTAEELEIIHDTARAFDRRHSNTARPRQDKTGDAPGHQFNAATRIEDLLSANGWKPAGKTTAGQGWTRPGKEQGVSGVLLDGTGNFYVWSSNAAPLEPGRSYDAFAIYTFYDHNGDFSAAARQLAQDGFGSSTETIYEDWEPIIKEWPTLPEKALHGIAGEFTRLATRSSEGDPAAVLATFLVRVAVEFGNGPTLHVGDTMHKARLTAVLVGDSSKSRKGTSSHPVLRLFEQVENKARYSPGPFSSGEGIINAVRDKVEKWIDKDQAYVVVDPGEPDKRLFVLDEEFAGAMAQTKREGNTLSMVIRNAWDNGNLDPLTKTNKIKATNAHVGWVSHITLFELNTRLDEAEGFNGFANRILWVCARRSRLVPWPEPMPEDELNRLRMQLVSILDRVQEKGFHVLKWSAEAKEAWCSKYYADLTKDHQGLVGCVINRGEAQVVRLAMIYCLLDGSDTITLDHLEAALAFWSYCEQSARFIFHGRQRDQVAQRILDALVNGPMTSTEIHRLFDSHVSRERIETSLSELSAAGRVVHEKIKTKGRPVTLWKLHTPCVKSVKSVKRSSTDEESELNTLNTLNTQGINKNQANEVRL